MGNMCSENESNFEVQNKNKRKVISNQSSKSTSGDNPEEQNADVKQIVSLLSLKNRTAKRVDCPEINHIKLISYLGSGAQAEVFRASAETREISKRYSLGEKVQIAIRRLRKNKNFFSQSTRLAIEILLQGQCNFILKGFFICETNQWIYQGIKFAEGRDLTSFLESTKGKGDSFRKLGEHGIKLILAGVILALQYLHQRGFLYCDLKTDNILIGSDGYPLLADFDLVRKGQTIPSIEFQGTLLGMGPEIFTNDKFDKSIDLWALGILIYTLVYNEAPFAIQDITEDLFPKLCISKQQKYRLNRKKASNQIIDLINKLLKANPKQRIGYNSIDEIKQHQFFNGLNWTQYQQKKIVNPISSIVQKFDKFTKLSESTQY